MIHFHRKPQRRILFVDSVPYNWLKWHKSHLGFLLNIILRGIKSGIGRPFKWNEIYCLSKLIWNLCIINKLSMSMNWILQGDCNPCNLTLWIERFVKTLQLSGKLILEKMKKSYWILSRPLHKIYSVRKPSASASELSF